MGRARPEPVRPGAQLSPPPPLSAGSLRLRLRLDPHPRFPVSTSWASNPHGRPDPSSRRLSSPDLQRSPSSRPPGLLSESLPRLGLVGGRGEGATSSVSNHRPQSPQARDPVGPRATGARSTPNIDSQVSSRVARDPLAAQCWIFPRDPLSSLERQTFRLSSRDAPSPQIQSPGRSTRSPPLPGLTLSTFLRGPQRSRNSAATAGHRRPPPPLCPHRPGTRD